MKHSRLDSQRVNMSDAIVLKVQQGQLKGVREVTSNGFQFNSFLGIPYAKPPLGSLRFQAPQPAEAWQGIRDATKEGDSCYCKDMLMTRMDRSEDCLYLNVYTPALSNANIKPKAVMVWIHGGGYTIGSGSREFYGPEYLIERDVVLVSINYRLGILGFLSLEDQSLAPRNVGLKDQVLALKWVQKNIHNFGGDPNNVTIFGESAGSGSVQLLTLSPLCKGLFHKAIMQSGSALAPWSFGKTNGLTICSLLGKETANEAEAFKILQSVSVEELINAQNSIPDLFYPGTQRLVGPVVEGHVKDAFLPDCPEKLLTSGAFHKVPMLIGHTSEEGLLIVMLGKPTKADLCSVDIEQYIPITFGIPAGTSKSKEIASRIKEFYFGNGKPCEENIHIIYEILSDTMFLHSIYKTVEETLKHSPEKVFLYKLSLKCELNQFAKLLNIHSERVSHGEDLFYLFKHSLLSQEHERGSIEQMAIEQMTKWWTNFAKYGDPNGVEVNALLQPTWPNVDPNKMQCMEISVNNTVLNRPEEKSIHFWKSIEKYAQAKL